MNTATLNPVRASMNESTMNTLVHSVSANDVSASLTHRMDIQNLNFYYNKGSDAALKSVSMPIYKNRVTALIGPSGCGKSTLLRTLNRIYMTCMGISTLKAKSYLMVRASLAIRTSMNCVPKWAWFSKNQRHFPCRYTKTWHLD